MAPLPLELKEFTQSFAYAPVTTQIAQNGQEMRKMQDTKVGISVLGDG